MSQKETVSILLLSNPVTIALTFMGAVHPADIEHNAPLGNYTATLPLAVDVTLVLKAVSPTRKEVMDWIIQMGNYEGILLLGETTHIPSIVALSENLSILRDLRYPPTNYRVMLAVPGPHTPETAWAALDPHLGTHPRPPLSTYDPYDPDRVRRALLDHLYQILDSMA